jgi:hypothetical protein
LKKGANLEAESTFNNQPVISSNAGLPDNNIQSNKSKILSWILEKNLWDPNAFHATFFLAPTSAFRKLEATENAGESLISIRNNSESRQTILTPGLWVGFGVNEHFVLRSGLLSLVRGENSNYTLPRQTDTIVNNDKNVYKYIGIPLVAGYQFDSDYFGVIAYTGISFDFLTSAQANIINDEGDDLQFISEKDLRKMQNSWIFGAELYLKLTKDLAVTCTPLYSRQLSSIFLGDETYTQKGTSRGIGFGIRANF